MARQHTVETDAIPNDVPDCAVVHVVPQADIRKHNTYSRGRCWCNPTIDEEGPGYVVVHNSADGREMFEDGRRLPS